jgi:hypothetical protein
MSHLNWIDGTLPMPQTTTAASKNDLLKKNYGAVTQSEDYDATTISNNPREVAAVIPFNSDEFIENETFKWVFLSIGICITGVIFYISTE